MLMFIAFISFIGILVFFILGIVNAIRKTGKSKKRFIYMIGCMLLMAVSLSTLGGQDSKTTASSQTKQKTQTKSVESKPKPVKKGYRIGDVVKDGKFEYIIHSVSETKKIKSNNQFIPSVVTKGKFVVLNYTVKNLDKKARTIDSSMFKLKGNGSEFDPSNGGNVDLILGNKSLFLQDLNPQLSRDGELVFEVPTNLIHYNLEVSPGFGFADILTEKKTINLK